MTSTCSTRPSPRAPGRPSRDTALVAVRAVREILTGIAVRRA
ncbi:MAG TPA: hypothetical protein VH703_02345 [Solirubrobacterales bacterium]